MSLLAFVVASIVIDAEVLVNLFLGYRPLHGLLHTYWSAIVMGLLSGAAVNGASSLTKQTRETWSIRPALTGGVLGGLSQPLLDSLMHTDIRPFWPLSEANSMLYAVDLQTLHIACTVMGVLGGSTLIIRWWQAPNGRQPR